MDCPIWCSLGLRCLAQMQNGHGVHESFHLWFEPTAFGFPDQIFNHYDSTNPDNVKHQKIAGSRSKIIISLSRASNGRLLWIKVSATRLLIKSTCLMDTVKKLEEDGSEATALAARGQVATLAEFVAKRQPLFLQKHLKAL